MKKAVIYARYSSHKQREESIERQLEICHQFAKDRNYEVIAEYCDRAQTDENGNIIHVDELVITTFNGEKTSEEIEENTKKYAYDKNGNLIRYETKSKIMTFTYTDETIHHIWERNIAIYYTGWYNIYTYPLFWNIK